jgi:WD40 repeat protein
LIAGDGLVEFVDAKKHTPYVAVQLDGVQNCFAGEHHVALVTADRIHVVALDGEELAVFDHDSFFTTVVFHPTRRILAAAHDDGSVHIWDFGCQRHLAEIDVAAVVQALHFAADSQLFAKTASHTVVIKLDKTYQPASVTKHNGDAEFCKQFHRLQARNEYFTFRDGFFQVWDLQSGSCLRSLGEKLLSYQIHPKRCFVAGDMGEGKVSVWSTDTLQLQCVLEFQMVNAFSFGSDDVLYVVAAQSEPLFSCKIYDLVP